MVSLAVSLDPSRFQLTVALFEDGPISSMLRERGKQVVIVPSMRPLLRGAPDRRSLIYNAVTLIPTVLALRRLVVEQSIDFIHTYAEPTIKYASVLRWLTGRRTFCTFLEAALPARNRTHRAGLVAALNHGVEAIISPSRSAAAGLIDAGVAPNKVTVIHNAVDVARSSVTEEVRMATRSHFGIGADEQLVVMAARFTRMKGHDVLLRALALVRDRGIPIRAVISARPLFAGEHEWHDHISRTVSTLGLNDQVKLAGWLDDLAPLYAASDMVVHPCIRADALPLAVIEAMAAGRPVIASDIGGLPELVDHNHTGLLVEPGSHIALADAVTELREHPDRAKQFGQNGKHRAVECFSLQHYAATVMALYSQGPHH